ncbi:SH3 domain-containing protein [Staphylococcus warneri]|uniref:SH3 domain-containing protein n=1 Tax=Staphylococcus warneri TaxID=1292 RepID=UPI0031E4118A
MKTKAQAKAWINSKVGKGIDFDGMYGYQCADLSVAYMYYISDEKIKMWGNAKDLPNNSFGNSAEVVKNYPAFKPAYGDIAVWSYGDFATYGHTALVVNPDPYGDLQYITVLEQNWNGNGIYKTEFATIRTHDYTGISHFIRPKFADETKKETKTVIRSAVTNKKVVTPKKSVERIKNYVKTSGSINGEHYELYNRGHKPKGVVIHNTAGTASATQEGQRLTNMTFQQLANGVAHVYIDKNTIYETLPEDRIAWHVAQQYGNTEFYGIEVCGSRNTNKEQFLANEQVAFQEAARRLKSWGMRANRNTVRLHHTFSSTECPDMSMLLHTGYSMKNGKPTQVITNKCVDYFIKQINAYIDGKQPTSTVVGSSSSNKLKLKNKDKSTGWNTNEYGTLWKKEHATFTCGVRQGIVTRTTGPFTSCPQAGILYYGQSVNYDTVCKQDGYVWISWTTNDGYDVWMPIRTWDRNTDKVSEIWGTIS